MGRLLQLLTGQELEEQKETVHRHRQPHRFEQERQMIKNTPEVGSIYWIRYPICNLIKVPLNCVTPSTSRLFFPKESNKRSIWEQWMASKHSHAQTEHECRNCLPCLGTFEPNKSPNNGTKKDEAFPNPDWWKNCKKYLISWWLSGKYWTINQSINHSFNALTPLLQTPWNKPINQSTHDTLLTLQSSQIISIKQSSTPTYPPTPVDSVVEAEGKEKDEEEQGKVHHKFTAKNTREHWCTFIHKNICATKIITLTCGWNLEKVSVVPSTPAVQPPSEVPRKIRLFPNGLVS